jgi:hypothetical protein
MIQLPPGFGMIEGRFAEDLLGITVEIIQAKDVKPGDVLVDFQCINFAHQTPAKITKAKRNGEFVHICWKGRDGKEGRQYAYTCLFGKVNE